MASVTDFESVDIGSIPITSDMRVWCNGSTGVFQTLSKDSSSFIRS
jgi:hypothetical protein